jgi:hypothetical protein
MEDQKNIQKLQENKRRAQKIIDHYLKEMSEALQQRLKERKLARLLKRNN